MTRTTADPSPALLAERVHMGQYDRNDEPHINHVRRVVQMVPGDCRTVAWLHDVLEDSDLTPERLFEAGFDSRTIYAVMTLTRDPGETYKDYIRRVATRPGEVGRIARLVKEADLLDNLRRCLEAQDSAAARYRDALHIIVKAH